MRDASNRCGGIVGGLYGWDGEAAKYTDVVVSNCVNYANIDAQTTNTKVAGIVAHAPYLETCKIERCINYGNITGGGYSGGVAGYWQPARSAESNKGGSNNGTGTFNWILDCDNFGNIVSKETGSYVGGVVAYFYRSVTTPIFNADGCNNYGNVGGVYAVAGLIGTTDPGQSSAPKWTVLTNNYNYGDVYNYGATYVGAYIAFEPKSSAINYIVSGGNLGTIFGVPATNNQNFGIDEKVRTGGDFLVAAGKIVTEFDSEKDMEASKYTEAVHKRYLDSVSRNIDEDGNYVYTKDEHENDTYRFVYKYEYADEAGPFVYEDAQHKTIIGLKDGADLSEGLIIPAGVEKIGDSAFVGHDEITSVTFNSELLEIGNFAFATMDLNSFELPASIKVIGAAAFAGNGNLNHVILDNIDEDVTLGKGAFKGTRVDTSSLAQGAYLIAKGGHSHYIKANDSFAISDGILTYEVKITYIYNNSPVKENGKDYVEYRLHGQDYRIVADEDGKWGGGGSSTIGPASSDEITYVWYYGENRVLTLTEINALLTAVNGNIELKAFSDGSEGYRDELIFVVREDLVYGQFEPITVDNINNILVNGLGNSIDNTMTVLIEGSKTGKIENAGTYTVTVIDQYEKEYELKVKVAQATIDLASIDNLEWFVTSIEGQSGTIKTSLMSVTLYIYTDSEGREYPSLDLLSADEIAELAENDIVLTGAYTQKTLNYSVVRNRGAEVTITIDTEGKGYGVVLGSYKNNSGTDVGKYTASVTLTPDTNHLFTVGTISSLRGMKITIDNDTNTAKVEKEWYIVELSNWLVDGNKNDYVIDDHEFGDSNFSVILPSTYYIGRGGMMTMHLSLNGTRITGVEGVVLNQESYSYYINSAMPAGTYELTIEVTGIYETIQDPDYPNDPTKTIEIYHKGFSEKFTFTVGKTALPSLKAVHDQLQKKSFESNITSNTIYGTEAQQAVNNYLQNTSTVDRSNTYWEDLDEYYTGYSIEFNLLRDYSDSYKSMTELLTSLASPDTYYVYYRITADNYFNSAENLTGETRYDYYFKVVRYQVLELPTISDKSESGELLYKYTGYEVLPRITGNDLYEIVWSDKEYITAKKHYVSYKLTDKEHYRWNGIESDTAVAEFTIGKATNSFTTALNISNWKYNSFDKQVNIIRAGVAFLDTGKNIIFSVTKEDGTAISGYGSFTINASGQVTNEIEALLKQLPSGKYKLIATVEESDNYGSVSAEIFFDIDKAQNAWKDGDDDLILPSWIVGRYDENNPITINAEHGTVNFKIIDIDDNEYYNSTDADADMISALNNLKVGKYLLVAWVDGDANFYGLLDRTFTIQIFERPGLPWWAVLLIVIGSLGLAALILFILWKKGVFQIVTDKILLAIRTRVSVESTIASVRAAKMMEEGKKSVADAKRRERLEKAREKQRSMTPEERAAELEAKAQAAEAKIQAESARIEKLRARSEAELLKAEKARGKESASDEEVQDEVAVTDTPDTPTEE